MDLPERFRSGGTIAGSGTQPGMKPTTPASQAGQQTPAQPKEPAIINPATGKEVAAGDAPGYYVVNPKNNQVRFMTADTWNKLAPEVKKVLVYKQVQ
jgi:hypothetical protein